MVRLDVTAGEYLRREGRWAVGHAVRKWCDVPASIRQCGDPVGGLLPVWGHPDMPRNGVGSLKQCRNRFACPYCSDVFRWMLAASITRTLRQALDDGHECGMVVLTNSRNRDDSLRLICELQQEIWAKLTTRPAWRDLRLDWLSVLDVMVGGVHGAHPHRNVPMILPKATTWDGVLPKIRSWWASPLVWTRTAKGRTKARGLWVAPERGAVVRHITAGNVDQLGHYSAKHLDKAGFEAVDQSFKRNSGGSGGYSLLDLACMAHAGQDEAGRLLGRCAADLAGRRSYNASKGWRARADALPDENVDAEAIYAGGLIFGLLPSRSYRRHREAIWEMLDGHRDVGLADAIGVWREINETLRLDVVFLDEADYAPLNGERE